MHEYWLLLAAEPRQSAATQQVFHQAKTLLYINNFVNTKCVIQQKLKTNTIAQTQVFSYHDDE